MPGLRLSMVWQLEWQFFGLARAYFHEQTRACEQRSMTALQSLRASVHASMASRKISTGRPSTTSHTTKQRS